MPRAQSTSGQFVSARTGCRAACPAPRYATSRTQPDDVADQHQHAAGRQRRIVDPHRKPQVRGAALVDRHGDRSTTCQPVPDQCAAERRSAGDAVEHLHPSRHAGWDDACSTRSGRTWLSVRDQLAGHDHDGPDQQVDDDLLGIADRLLRERSSATRPARPRKRARPGRACPTSVCSTRSHDLHHAAVPDPQPASSSAQQRWTRSADEIRDTLATAAPDPPSCRVALGGELGRRRRHDPDPVDLHDIPGARLRGRHARPGRLEIISRHSAVNSSRSVGRTICARTSRLTIGMYSPMN